MGIAMTPAEAFAAIPLAAVCCDSTFSRDEAQLLRHQLIHRAPYRTMEALPFAEMVDGLLRRFRQGHWQELIRLAVPALTPLQQETAFALAAQIVYCDRVVQPEEAAFLATLGAELELPAGQAHQIQEVFALLERDCLAE